MTTKWLRYLVAGVGLPFVAQQLHEQAQNISQRLMFVTFVNEKRGEVCKLAVSGLFAVVLSVCGFSLALFSMAQKIDFVSRSNASVLVALFIFILGLILGAYTWRGVFILEKKYEKQLYMSQQPASFVKAIFGAVFH